MAVSKRLRYEILRRDNHACRYCGATAPDATLTVDHVVPVTLGGSDEPTNLVTACRDCNAGKSSASADHRLVADVSGDALRWATAMKRAAEAATADLDLLQRRRESFHGQWAAWHTTTKRWENGGQVETHHPIPMDTGWEQTIDRFYESGLNGPIIAECIRIAMGSRARPDDTWRYFCGVAWRKIRELQEAAQATLAAEEAPAPQRLPDDLGPEEQYAIGQYGSLAEVCDGAVY